MTIEADLRTLLASQVADRVYPLVAPPQAVAPFIVYQQIGGDVVSFMTGAPDIRNARMQLRCWADTPSVAKQLALGVEAAILGATAMKPTALGAMGMSYDEDTNLFGSLQDFSLWYPP